MADLDGDLRPQAGWIGLDATEIGNALVDQRRRSFETTHEIAREILCRSDRKNVDGVNRQIEVGPLQPVVFLLMLVLLNREPTLEKGVIDGLIRVQVIQGNLPQLAQRLFDESLFRSIVRFGVVIEQMVVAFNPVVDRLRWVEIEIGFEEIDAKFAKGGHVLPWIFFTYCAHGSSPESRTARQWESLRRITNDFRGLQLL